MCLKPEAQHRPGSLGLDGGTIAEMFAAAPIAENQH